jgi:site-specific DNA-methyltransferase (adenine-specific)
MNFLKGDCLEVMKTLPDKSIDCFVCDLPYGCLRGGAGKERAKRQVIKNIANNSRKECPPSDRSNGIFNCDWDVKIDLVKFWEQVKRLAKDDHTPVLMFCTTKFGAELIASNPSWFRYDLVWNKLRGVGFLKANKQPMRSHEMIYVFSKKGAYYKRIDIKGTPYSKKSKEEMSEQYGVKRLEGNNEGTRCVLSVVDCLNSAGHHRKGKIGNHPTQKPAELYEWLLKRYCRETMLDATAGSFTSCFVAHKLGFKAIGIEMNEEFYDNAVARI